MSIVEDFAVISGQVSEELERAMKEITTISKERYGGITKGHHEWINKIDDAHFVEQMDHVRKDTKLLAAIQEKFPGAAVTPVPDIDEVYWSVSPKNAKGSDRSLVDCHYDTPFGFVPSGGVVLYRVLVSCNENTTVSTRFPGENVTVKMSTRDYHGFDFNTDYHCVDGEIPPGKSRVILKLHYLVVPKGSERWADITLSWNKWWAVFSRNAMNMSSDPKNIWELILSYIINVGRILFFNLKYILLGVVALIVGVYYIRNRGRASARRRR